MNSSNSADMTLGRMLVALWAEDRHQLTKEQADAVAIGIAGPAGSVIPVTVSEMDDAIRREIVRLGFGHSSGFIRRREPPASAEDIRSPGLGDPLGNAARPPWDGGRSHESESAGGDGHG